MRSLWSTVAATTSAFRAVIAAAASPETHTLPFAWIAAQRVPTLPLVELGGIQRNPIPGKGWALAPFASLLFPVPALISGHGVPVHRPRWPLHIRRCFCRRCTSVPRDKFFTFFPWRVARGFPTWLPRGQALGFQRGFPPCCFQYFRCRWSHSKLLCRR